MDSSGQMVPERPTSIDLIFGMGAKDAGSITVLGLNHIVDEVAMKRQVWVT